MKNNKATLYYSEANGPLAFTMANAYMFRAVLQTNSDTLKSITCSLLHLEPARVRSIRILNSIQLGHPLKRREAIIDVLVELTNFTSINLELQIDHLSDEPEHSLLYLCKSFDHTDKIGKYSDFQNLSRVRIMNTSLKNDFPEFYSIYSLTNDRIQFRNPGNFSLYVLSLNNLAMANRDDRQWSTDLWAKFLQINDWSIMQEFTNKHPEFTDTAKTLLSLNCNDGILRQCELLRHLENYDHAMAEHISRLRKNLSYLGIENKLLNQEIQQLKKVLENNNIKY